MSPLELRLILPLVVVIVILAVCVALILRRLHANVAADHVLFVQSGEHVVPLAPGQGFWYWPRQKELGTIPIRRRGFQVLVPGIALYSGLSVNVQFSYEASLAVEHMSPDEYLLDEEQRQEIVVGCLKRHLQRLIEKYRGIIAAPPVGRLGLAAFISPLYGEHLEKILSGLNFHVRQEMERHGIMIADRSIKLDHLHLDEDLVAAYHKLEWRGFGDADRYEFVTQAKTIAPGVSESVQINLYHAATGPGSPLHPILSGGVIAADLLVADRSAEEGFQRTAEGEEVSLASLAPKQDYPLTVEDMLLLKELGS